MGATLVAQVRLRSRSCRVYIALGSGRLPFKTRRYLLFYNKLVLVLDVGVGIPSRIRS